MKFRAAASFYAALLLALGGFASSALAGDHGHSGGDQGHGNTPSQQSQSSRHDGTTTTTTTSSGDNSTGVKPSNKTFHDTHANASSDKTKKYGNGQTAGQIATKAGYGNADLHGPGNSQPHKVSCGGHEVDVHALKHKQCGSSASEHKPKPEEHTTTQATTTESVKPDEHKVTICHKTGSATNPYVEITVDEHALKNGHTTAKGDIIPAPASGCPTGQVAGTTETQTTSTEQSCTETKTVTEQVVVGVKHFIGPKGSGRFVIIHPNSHSSHYRDKHPDEFVYQTVTKTETVPSSCPSTTTTESVTTTAAATTTEQSTTEQSTTEQSTTEQTTTTTQAAAVAGSTAPPSSAAAPAGGVLGAVSPLHTAKSKPAGGVLGATVRLGKKVGGTTLPFTGLPLWIFALVAAALILVGAFARRAGSEA